MKNFIRYLLVVGLMGSFTNINASDLGNAPKSSTMLRSMNNKQLEITLTPITQNGDEIKLELSIKGIYGPLKGDLTIDVQVGKKITLKSPSRIKKILKGEEELKYTIELYIPKGVSSAITVMAGSNTYVFGGSSRLFIRNIADTMEYTKFHFETPKKEPLYQDPDRDTLSFEQLNEEYELYIDLTDKEKFDYIKKISDTLILSKKEGVYKAKISLAQIYEIGERGFEAEFVHRPPWDKRTTPWKNYETPPDSTQKKEVEIIEVSEKMPSRTEILQEKKSKAEEHVLTDKPSESIYIDGVMWQRNKGEQYFHIIEPITDTDAYIKHINDSLDALPDKHLFEVCIKINKDQLNDVTKLVGELPEPINGKYYHIKIQKGDLPKLRDLGVSVGISTRLSCDHSREINEASSKKN